MAGWSNRLTPAQAERLAVVAEELGEAIQAIGKILRHGYESTDPTKDGGNLTNRAMLERELGDIEAAVWLLTHNGDVNDRVIWHFAHAKMERVPLWLHQQHKMPL